MAMEMVAGGTFGPMILVELGLRCPSEVPSKEIGEGAKDSEKFKAVVSHGT